MTGSLLRRLQLWVGGAVVAVGAATAAVSGWRAYTDANDLEDRQLVQVAAVIESRGVPVARPPEQPLRGEDAETHYVIKALGTPTGADPLTDVALPADLGAGFATLAERGVKWRAYVATAHDGTRFAVAQRMRLRDEEVRDTVLFALAPPLLSIPFLLLVTGLVIRRGLEPLLRLSDQMDSASANAMAPFEEAGMPDELRPVVHALNRLTARLGLAMAQQRRLVSDAAHELRTPVAALVVQADNVMRVDMPEAARQRMDALRGGLVRISSLIDQLLSYARVQGLPPAPRQAIALDALVRGIVEELMPLAGEHGVEIGASRLEPVAAEGDPLHARVLVRNAIDNALRYTPPGGEVDVQLWAEDGRACLVIEDTGPGIDAAERDRVFEPFVRILGSKQPGSGLGLAIARTAAAALGGEIRLDARPDGRSGLRFTYRQPLR
jgi:two-component system OmpR family sensor kinase